MRRKANREGTYKNMGSDCLFSSPELSFTSQKLFVSLSFFQILILFGGCAPSSRPNKDPSKAKKGSNVLFDEVKDLIW